MKFLIIGAMQEEVSLIQAKLTDCKTEKLHHLEFNTGVLHTHNIALVQCGIGKVASTIATSILIDRFRPDAVINTGSAGGFDPELNVGDVVIAEKLLHHDVNVTHFGYSLGQVPQMPLYYHSDNNLVNLAKESIKTMLDVQVKTGLICSGDSFVGSDEAAQKIKDSFPDMTAVEMEGAAIAQVCHLMKVPFIVIRSLSDIAGKTSSVSFEEYLTLAAKNSAQLVMNMIKTAK